MSGNKMIKNKFDLINACDLDLGPIGPNKVVYYSSRLIVHPVRYEFCMQSGSKDTEHLYINKHSGTLTSESIGPSTQAD